MSAEDDRAAAYRVQQMARLKNKRSRERALKGNPARAKALRDATAALLPVDVNGVPRVGMEDRC